MELINHRLFDFSAVWHYLAICELDMCQWLQDSVRICSTLECLSCRILSCLPMISPSWCVTKRSFWKWFSPFPSPTPSVIMRTGGILLGEVVFALPASHIWCDSENGWHTSWVIFLRLLGWVLYLKEQQSARMKEYLSFRSTCGLPLAFQHAGGFSGLQVLLGPWRASSITLLFPSS
jgi:hypothetical protein